MTTISPMWWNTWLEIKSQKLITDDNKDIMYLKLIIYFSDIQKWNQMMSMMTCLVISYIGWPDMFLQTVKKESRQCPLWSTFVTGQKCFVKLEWSNRILLSWPAVLQIFVWNTTSPSKECFTVYFQIVPWTIGHLCFQPDRLSASLISKAQL